MLKKGTLGLARHRPGQQRLAGAGRADQQHAPGQAGAEVRGSCSGFFRKSTTSSSSALASSSPATSAKVTPGLLLVVEARLAAAEAEDASAGRAASGAPSTPASRPARAIGSTRQQQVQQPGARR